MTTTFKIQKLITEYKGKIGLCDFSIETIKESARQFRNALTSSEAHSYSELIVERKLVEAQRQAYVQFIADLDSLLD